LQAVESSKKEKKDNAETQRTLSKRREEVWPTEQNLSKTKLVAKAETGERAEDFGKRRRGAGESAALHRISGYP
jgi:hypothetical protein